MSLRPCRVHACFQQVLGEIKKPNCKCKYRVSMEQAKQLVEQGLASWLIVDYKNGVPVTSWNLVWGSKPEDEPETLVRSALAAKTPRVQTIEKAHIERWVVDGKQEEGDRIEEWGNLARQVIAEMIVPFVPDPYGCGRPILPLIGLDQRTNYSRKR